MDWLLYSGLMFASSVALYMLLRKMQKVGLPGSFINLILVAIPLPVLIISILISGTPLWIGWPMFFFILVVSFVLVYIGNTASLIGIENAPNSGYSLIIQKSYAIYTSIAAALLFGSELNVKSIIGIITVIVFMAVVIISKPKQGEKIKFESKWILPSLLAFFLFGTYSLTSKWIMLQKVDPSVLIFYVYFFTAFMYGFSFWRERTAKLFVLPKMTTWIVSMLILMGLAALGLDFFMQSAANIAPNVGFVSIMNTASISMVTLLSALFFKDKLSLQKIIEIIGVTVGIAILVIK